MKLQFERIEPETGSSFKVMHHTEPDLCGVYWHYHPEHEIVYIPEGSGKCHIGQHISRYENGYLVFIGPNVPHLNFGHGADLYSQEMVVQLRETFLGDHFLHRPELVAIRRLFERAHRGLYFGEETRENVGPLLMQLPGLNAFDRMLTLLRIFQDLATAIDVTPLHADGIRFDLNPREQERINRISRYVEAYYRQPINMQEVADLANLTIPAFCRYFKRLTQMTFTDFVNEYRVNQARRLLNSSRTVADISYEVGFNNLSHFNKTFRAVTGQTPSAYRHELV
ncbi:AraC family transcriptional regulator [Nibrella saemangeumensis]|uniref:AraC family transcriptional regulator n=1 Tax=Nibrella saemangeumensis TaxID=1084526 RepID=A0ABP8M964_9BACT